MTKLTADTRQDAVANRLRLAQYAARNEAVRVLTQHGCYDTRRASAAFEAVMNSWGFVPANEEKTEWQPQ